MFAKLDTYRRLLISQFLLGMMFFYGIEQLFINHALHDAAARGPITIAFTVGVLLFDVPTGILADRLGRKVCLLAGCGVGILSLVIAAPSQTVVMYIIGSLLFGLFISFHNGALEALLYDWLVTRGERKRYAQCQGNIWAAYLLGAGVANVASGVLVQILSLRATYWLSIVPIALATLLLTGLHEPAKAVSADKRGSLSQALRLIIHRPRILAFGLQFIAAEVLFMTVGEFGQIYILSFGVGTVTLGFMWAVTAVFGAMGRSFAHKLQARPRLAVGLYCAALGSFMLVRREFGIGLFWLVYGLTETTENIAETEVQHETTSEIRATVVSIVSFAANVIAIPALVAYTAIYKQHTIFSANIAVIGFCGLLLLVTLAVRPPKQLTAQVD